MGRVVREYIEFSCDRCDATASTLEGGNTDFRTVSTGSASLTGTTKPKWLCPTCVGRYEFFMMGTKTPAGIRFNIHEGLRMQYAGAGFQDGMPEWLQTTAGWKGQDPADVQS